MNNEQYLLICIEEECLEVAQRISKALRFGIDEVQMGQDENNRQRINDELNDLMALLEMAADNKIISLPEDKLLKKVKRIKFNKFRDYSQALGIIKP